MRLSRYLRNRAIRLARRVASPMHRWRLAHGPRLLTLGQVRRRLELLLVAMYGNVRPEPSPVTGEESEAAATSLRDIINFIGTSSGINITYDANYVDKAYTIILDGVTVEDALQQVLSANQYYYKVVNQRTIIVIPDQPAKHQQYDDLVMKVFYISHSDATELK